MADERAIRALRERSFAFAFALVLALALLVANLFVDASFVGADALPETLAALAPFALVAMATSPSIIVGGLDLSAGPLVTLVNVMLVTVLLPAGLGDAWLSIPILLALGAAVGAINGALVACLRLPAVITGLCGLFVIGGIALELQPMPEQAERNWTDDLGGSVGPIPGALLALAVPSLIWLALRRTPLVGAMYAVGGDDATAYAAGVNVAATKVIAYALGGMFAAIAGFALTGLIRSADPTLGLQYTLIAIAAVSLGGTPLGGGRGGLAGAVLGATCIYLIQNFLSGVGVSALWLQLVYGCVLIAAVVVGAQLVRARPAEAVA